MYPIQNAYNGFAKGTFNMLDNLKLGYGGTKEEMQRLLSDAEKLSGIKFDISSYSDIIEAIHVVQTEMGITGTTAREASSTIQGSIGAMKSAWGNLVAGLAGDSQNLDQLIGNFVDSVATAGENVLPRIETALSGIGEMISALAPVIAEEVPTLIENVLPSMLDAGAQLLGGIMEGLVNAVPALSGSLVQVGGTIVAGLQEATPQVAETGNEIVQSLLSAITENLPQVIDSGAEVLTELVSGIAEMLPQMEDAALEIITVLSSGISDSLPELIPTVVDVVLQIVDTLTDPDSLDSIISAALEIITALADGLIESLPELLGKAPEIVGNLVDSVVENAPKLLTAAFELVGKLASGIIDNLPEIGNAAREIIDEIVSSAADLAWKILNVGKDIVSGVWDGMNEKYEWSKEKASGLFGGMVDSVKKLLGINSPSKLFRQEIGQYISLGVAEGISDTSDKAVKAADKMAKDVYSRSKDWADKQTKYAELTYDEQIDLWETIQSQFISSSKQYSDAEEKIFDLRQKKLKASAEAEKAIMSELEGWVKDMEHEMFLNEKNNQESMDGTIAAYRAMQERVHETAEEYRSLNYAENSDEIQKLQKLWWNYEDAITKQQEDALKARTDAQQEFVSNIESIQKELEKLQNDYLKELSKRTEEIANSYKLFDKVADHQEVNGKDLIDNLAGQISSIRGF